MPRKPIAIVAAMRVELAPLLREDAPQQVDGVELFELPRRWLRLAVSAKSAPVTLPKW